MARFLPTIENFNDLRINDNKIIFSVSKNNLELVEGFFLDKEGEIISKQNTPHFKYFEVNKETWNKKVSIHSTSEFYDIKGFKKGKTSLNAYELEELGDVKGKKLLHLQCHFGQDTLSWSRLGAKCTGIDLSNEGIKLAKKLNLSVIDLPVKWTHVNQSKINFIRDFFKVAFSLIKISKHWKNH